MRIKYHKRPIRDAHTYPVCSAFETLSMPISYNLIHVGKMYKDDCLFVSLGFFLSHSRIFQSFVDVPIADEELQILTYARHSWSLSKRDL